MKKPAKRALSLTLVLLLFLSVPMTARAEVVTNAAVPTATMSWEENLQPCTATLRIPGEEYIISVPITDASIVHVTNGEAEVITWPQGNCAEQTPEYTAEPTVADGVRLNTLLGELGYDMDPMCRELEGEEQDSIYFVVPTDLPAGKYSYGAEFNVIDAEWWIQRGTFNRAIALPSGAEEGDIIGIPDSCTAIKLIVISLD